MLSGAMQYIPQYNSHNTTHHQSNNARQTFSFADTAKKCTAAIHSLNEVTGHIRQHGDVDGSTVVKKADRKLKMQLYTQRSAARIKLGRYRSAAVDYARVLNMGSATKDYVLASTPGGGRKEVRRYMHLVLCMLKVRSVYVLCLTSNVANFRRTYRALVQRIKNILPCAQWKLFCSLPMHDG